MKRVFILISVAPAMLYGDTVALSSSLALLASAGLGYSVYLLYRIARVKQERDQALEKQKADANILYLQSRYASMGETLGNIAHQWKQPLNAIGSIQNSIKAALIFQGEISKEKLLSSVDTSFGLLQHLAETIDTFYSFLAQSGNKTTLFFIADELEKVRKITEYSFENSNIRLTFELNINPPIQGNANEFTHALLNLILNAKDAFDTHTAENPTITVRVVGRDETCTITVTDNAGGIRIKPVEMVFDLHMTTKENGSGLGLFMTKNIIENRFGGNLSVNNTKDGACFTIELPYAEYNDRHLPLTQDEKLTLDRINELSRKIIELEEVEKALQKWADIFKKAHWAIAIHIGTSNYFESTNEAFNSLYGYTPQEVKDISVPDLFPPETLSILSNVQKEAFENGYTTFETVNKRKDGSTFPVSVELIVIKDENGEILYHIANIWDLTEKKAADWRLHLKKFALDHVNDAVFLADENGNLHYVNDGACSALGYSRDELLKMEVGDLDSDWPRERWPEFWNALKKTGSMRIEVRHRRKDGSSIPVEVSANYIEFDGIGFNMGIARDITERLALEAEKENRLIKTVAENSPDVIIRYDVEGHRTYANPKARELLGVEVGKSPSEETPIIDKEYYIAQLQNVIKTGTEATFEITYTNAIGTIDYSHIRMVPEFGDNGNITSVLMIGRNITEYKQTLNALEIKERELRALAESSPGMMGTFHLRADGSVCMPYVSPNIRELFGVTPEEVREDAAPLLALSHPDDAERVYASILKSAKTMSVWHEEYRILHPTKGERWMESNTMPQMLPQGGIIWYGYIHDITERKIMEASVQEANDRYIQILDNSTDVIYLIEVTPEGKYVYVDVNAAYEEVTGISRESVIGLCVDDIENETFREILIDKFNSCLNVGCETDYVADYPFPGGIRTFQSLLTPIYGQNGRIVRIVGSARDITERNAMEEKIRQNEKNLNNAQKLAKLGSWHLDIQGGVLTWSDETYRIFELDREFITDLHTTFYEIVHPDDRAEVRDLYVESLNAKTSYEMDHRILMNDGRIKYVIERCEHVYGADGTPLYSNGTVQDITERKLMEKELAESHRFLNDLIDAVPDPIFVKNRTHTWILFNQAFCNLSGLPKEALIGKSDHDVFPKEEADIFWEKDEIVFKSGEINVNEESFTSTDGVSHHIQTVKAMFVGSDGKEYLVGTIRDLSERKAMENDLRKALEFNEGVIGAIPDSLFEIAPDGTYVGIWAQNEELLIQQRAALLGKNFKELLPPDVVITSLQAMKEVDEKGLSLGKTYRLDLPNGTRWFELSVTKKKMSGNYIALARDITERKRAEEALQSNRNLLYTILESSPGVITFALDNDYRYLAFDSKHAIVMHTVFGKEIAVGMDIFEVIGEVEDAKIAKRSFDRALSGESFIAEEDYGDERLSHQYWQIFYSPIRAQTGEIIGLACFNVDITERKKAENEIRELNETLEDRVKERTYQLMRALEFNEGIINALPDLLFEVDRNGRYLGVWTQNPQLLAAQRELLLNHSFDDILSSEATAIAMDAIREAEERGLSFGKTIEIELADGIHWFELSASKKSSEGTFLFISRDISERVKAEKALREREEMFRAIVENSPDVISSYDLSMRRTYANPMMLFLLGKPLKEVIGKTPREFSPLPDIDDFEQMFYTAVYGKEEVERDGLYHTPWGEVRWSNHRIVPMFNGEHEVEGVMLIGRDITERKNSEKQLLMVETAINSSTEAVYISDQSLNIIYVNDGACRMLGYSREELLGMSIVDIEARYTSEEIHGLKESTLNEPNMTFETRHRRKDGSIIDVEIVGTSFAYESDEIILSVVKEITERKKMEKALRYREEYQRTLLDNFPYFVWLKDQESRLLAANIQYARVANVKSTADLEGKTDFDFFPQELSEKYVSDDQAVMREGKPKNVEEPYADEYGDIRWMETWKSPVWVNGEIVGTVGCSRDITERKEMETALRESEARYREIFDNTSDALYLLEVTPEGRYKNIAFNRAFERSTGIAKESLIGTFVDEFPDEESVRKSIEKYDRCVSLGEMIEERAVLNLPNGIKTYRSILIPIKNDEGRVVRIIGLAREEQ